MSLPQNLKLLRAEHNMTQADLAKRINVARTTVAGYETRNRQPSHEKLSAIAGTFGVSVDYLLRDDQEGACMPLSLQHERFLDERVFTLYRSLTLRSKEDAYEYLRLLALREKSE